jgi:hypothetical protein
MDTLLASFDRSLREIGNWTNRPMSRRYFHTDESVSARKRLCITASDVRVFAELAGPAWQARMAATNRHVRAGRQHPREHGNVGSLNHQESNMTRIIIADIGATRARASRKS